MKTRVKYVTTLIVTVIVSCIFINWAWLMPDKKEKSLSIDKELSVKEAAAKWGLNDPNYVFSERQKIIYTRRKSAIPFVWQKDTTAVGGITVVSTRREFEIKNN